MHDTTISWSRYVAALLLASTAVLLAGCGGDRSYVSGTVTYDDAPLPNASITFTSLEQGPGGSATTNARGEYEAFMSLNNDWLAPGEYQVEILGYADVLKMDGLAAEITPTDVSLPKKYRGENSELRATAKPGSCVVDFDLKSE